MNSLITEEMKEMVNKRALREFLTSDVALRMAKADAKGNLFREKPFVMDYNDVLVQGIIDVFWMNEDKVFLLDYKTDRVDTADELIARYKTQLDLYAEVLKRIFSTKEHNIKDVESLIYSFKLKEVIII
jgi:ATP-dependent helicase/nuclease subunit A